jgi:two-component sensor histidine kinase
MDRTACSGDVEYIGPAVREALPNAIAHGNHRDPEKNRISVAVSKNCDLLLIVKDSGSGFDVCGLRNPTAGENLFPNHGRGVFLIKQLMDHVDFKFDHGPRPRRSVVVEAPAHPVTSRRLALSSHGDRASPGRPTASTHRLGVSLIAFLLR